MYVKNLCYTILCSLLVEMGNAATGAVTCSIIMYILVSGVVSIEKLEHHIKYWNGLSEIDMYSYSL